MILNDFKEFKMLPGGPGGDSPGDPPEDPPGDPPELGRFKAFLFHDFGPGGRGPPGSNPGVSWGSPGDRGLLGSPGGLLDVGALQRWDT